MDCGIKPVYVRDKSGTLSGAGNVAKMSVDPAFEQSFQSRVRSCPVLTFSWSSSLALGGIDDWITFKQTYNKLSNQIKRSSSLALGGIDDWITFKQTYNKLKNESLPRTLGYYSRPSHEGYRNTIELPEGNNVVPLRSDTIRLEIIENLALYDHESWNDPRDFTKPVKAISSPQSIPKTPNRRLLELEDQISYMLKRSRTTPKTSSTQIPQAYANVVSLTQHTQNFNEPPRENSFTFQKRAYLNPQQRTLTLSFEAQVQGYMASHTERMEKFKEAIFKQNKEINERMTKMFSLLKELTKSKSLEKVLVREEVSNRITKYVNTISIVRIESDKGTESNKVVDKNAVDLIELVNKEEEMDDESDNESNGSLNEDSTRWGKYVDILMEML
nr:MAK10-like protein [Tanacetum cinerariifolium]